MKASVKPCIPFKRYGKSTCCVSLEKPPDKPDPAIYTQQEIISQGMMPTWNNPDIITNHWDPWTLDKIPTATVRNLSGTVGAINVQVTFSYAQFGIGFNRIPVASHVINLPPGGEQTLDFTLSPAVAAGPPFLSTWVNIVPSADKRSTNNEGLQTIYGAHSTTDGRNPVFNFPVFNNSSVARHVSLVTYANELAAQVTPASFLLAAFEQKMISIHLHVPPGMHAAAADNLMKEATIAAFLPNGQLLGGVTYIIKIDN